MKKTGLHELFPIELRIHDSDKLFRALYKSVRLRRNRATLQLSKTSVLKSSTGGCLVKCSGLHHDSHRAYGYYARC